MRRVDVDAGDPWCSSAAPRGRRASPSPTTPSRSASSVARTRERRTACASRGPPRDRVDGARGRRVWGLLSMKHPRVKARPSVARPRCRHAPTERSPARFRVDSARMTAKRRPVLLALAAGVAVLAISIPVLAASPSPDPSASASASASAEPSVSAAPSGQPSSEPTAAPPTTGPSLTPAPAKPLATPTSGAPDLRETRQGRKGR